MRVTSMAFDDAVELAEHDDADLVLVEVERQAERAVGEPDELVRHDAGKALDVRDAVRGVHDVADLGGGGLARPIRLNEVLERVADLVRANRYFCHFFPIFAGPFRPESLDNNERLAAPANLRAAT